MRPAGNRHGWRVETLIEQGCTDPSPRHHHVRTHGSARDPQHIDDRLAGRVDFTQTTRPTSIVLFPLVRWLLSRNARAPASDVRSNEEQ